jgi:manganese/zinc/iron transport system permease protein
MDPTSYRALVIILTGALVAASCALLGAYLVLRRMALLGDAISHAILPGIVLGFLATQSRHPLIMLLGAAAAGLLTVWLIEVLHRTRRLNEDSSIAVVFPALFALGVLLVSQIRYVDLDLDCVVFGKIEETDGKVLRVFGLDLGPRSLWFLGTMLVVNLTLILVFWKELKVCTFDPALAESLGFSPARMHYLLMTAVSLTTVAAFEAVGAVLVVAFLIVPAATAYLLTDRLWLLLTLAVGFGVLAVVSGYGLASEAVLNSVGAGAMATMAGVIFLLVWLAAPRHGLLATLRRQWKLRRRFAADLLLLHLQKTGATDGVQELVRGQFHWSLTQGERVLHDLTRRGLIERTRDAITLTPAGEQAALRLEQAYRP